MAQVGIDVLLVCTEPEVRYFSGLRRFWQSPTRRGSWSFRKRKPLAGSAWSRVLSRGSMMSNVAAQPQDDDVSLLIDCVMVGGRSTVYLWDPLYAARRPRLLRRSLVTVDAPAPSVPGRFVTCRIAKHRYICSAVWTLLKTCQSLKHRDYRACCLRCVSQRVTTLWGRRCALSRWRNGSRRH